MTDITIKIGGEAGFGIMTTGILLGKIATRSGFHAFEYSEYPSLIRGGHNVVEVRISDQKVFSQCGKIDILICLNLETFRLHKDKLKESALVVFDRDKTDISKIKITDRNISYVHVPFARMIEDAQLNKLVMNNIALGVLVYLLHADIEILNALIAENFAKKPQEVIDKNIQAAKLGYEYAGKNWKGGYNKKMVKKSGVEPRMYINGNEMIGLGAIAAGCKLYVAYPMTPASGILHYLAAKSESSGMVVKHAEDEISVINMALGGSFAGVRSMVATSGGGFALMVESVSLAGMTETPIVIAMVQRPGPATGIPTWTQQGDLLFVIHSGHGEFPKIVLAPGDVEETYKLTVEAFNLADKYQTPVFILGDKYLMEGRQSVDQSKISGCKLKIDRGKVLTEKQLSNLGVYKRYLVTDDGVSPRAMLGHANSLQQANSYEHLEDGHTTEDPVQRIKQVDKRRRKTDTFLSEDVKMPELFGENEAPLTVISWGSTKGPILQAMKGHEAKFNYLHFSYLWPLPGKKLKDLLDGLGATLLVENNSSAQLGQLLMMTTGVEISNKLLKYSGRPIYPDEVLKKVEELAKA